MGQCDYFCASKCLTVSGEKKMHIYIYDKVYIYIVFISFTDIKNVLYTIYK